MKKDNYKSLGKYIQQTDVRNVEFCDYPLLGVSVEKKLIPSVANTVGTDFSNYKILFPNEFVFIADTSRRGDKIAIALNKTGMPALVSSAYTTFKVDEECLLSDYLLLWVVRPEFDRYARYMSHGSVRELFSWEEMCKVTLPVPPIEEQRRIVSEYQTVEARIKNNEALIQKLEETAQAIYHHTFVEGIDEENLPEGWRKESLYNSAIFLNGLPCQKYEDERGLLPVLKIRELSQGFSDDASNRVDESFPEEYVVKSGDIIFSWSATLIVDFWCHEDCALNQHLFKVTSDKYPKWFVFMWIQHYITIWKRLISAKATSMGHIKKEDLQNAMVLVPTENVFIDLDKKIGALFNYLNTLKQELHLLRKLLSLLTSKLA